MADFPNMRLYQNANGGSPVPLAESANSGWKTPAEMGGGFSAMCWCVHSLTCAALICDIDDIDSACVLVVVVVVVVVVVGRVAS